MKVTKATASRRLAELERALDASLIERAPAGMRLTKAGLAALDAAQGMEQAMTELQSKVADASGSRVRGSVRLTAPQWLAEDLFIPALPELKARHSDLEIELVGTNRLLNIVQREADLAVRNVRPTQKSLATRRLPPIGGCVYASKIYLARKGLPAKRGDVRAHDVLAYESLGGMPGFEWMRDPAKGGRITFRANDPVTLASAAAAGMGLCAVPRLIGDPHPALVRVEPLGITTSELFLVMRTESRTDPRVRAAADFLVAIAERHAERIAGQRKS